MYCEQVKFVCFGEEVKDSKERGAGERGGGTRGLFMLMRTGIGSEARLAGNCEQHGQPEGHETLDALVNLVSTWEEVPLFDGEEAEAAYWADTRIDLRLMENAVASSAEGTDSVTITLRMDPRMLGRIKRLARERYLNYQSMIKQWLSERMEHELRGR